MAATLDRLDLLEKAATLVQRGELTAALPEYIRLFQRHPQDWNVANTLGDLYARVGRTDDAIAHFSELAERLAADGFTSKARALYRKILRLRPDNEIAQHRVQQLDTQCVGVSPFLQRVLQTARAAREAHAQEVAAAQVGPPAPSVASPEPPPPTSPPIPEPLPEPQVVFVEETPAPTPAVVEARVTPPTAEWETIALTEPESAPPLDEEQAFREADALVSGAAGRGEFAAAAAALEIFLESRPLHIVALERLIEIGVDGKLPLLDSAQSRLADACRAAGFIERAEAIEADLEWRNTFEPVETPRVEPVVLAADETAFAGTFEDVRDGLLREAMATAEARFAEGERLMAENKAHEALTLLEEAMCLPHLRIPSGARLAQVHRAQGAAIEALACLEWVAQMPPATEDDGHELAYELALTLEALDQQEQALGVYRELLAEVGPTYRDVARRAERLAAA